MPGHATINTGAMPRKRAAASPEAPRSAKQHRGDGAEQVAAAATAAAANAAAAASPPTSEPMQAATSQEEPTVAAAAAAAAAAEGGATRQQFCWWGATQQLAAAAPRAAGILAAPVARLGSAGVRCPLAVPPQELLTALHEVLLADASIEETLLPMLRAFRPLMIAIVSSCVQAQQALDFDLRRHERLGATLSLLACLMSRPEHVLLLLDEYYRKAPSIFERLDRGDSADEAALLDIAQTSWRLLGAGHRGETNWAPVFVLLRCGSEHVRWYATRCVALLLGLSAESLKQLCGGNGIAAAAPLSLAYEAEVIAAENAVACAASTVESKCGVEKETLRQWVEGLTVIDDIIFPTRARDPSMPNSRRSHSPNSFVLTGACQSNLRSVATALAVGKPVMLEGPPGVGKTALLDELAKSCGHFESMIRIHLDDQLDSKTLLGSYVCADEPGQFKWQPGALTQAVRGGRWIVFEDVHNAPFELLAAIKPLLEDRVLFVAGRGERIQAASGFQLFATQTVHDGSGGNSKSSHGGIFANLFTHVPVDPLPAADIRQILEDQFAGDIGCCIPLMLDTFDAFRINRMGPVLGRSGFSLRDLIKWCRRVQLLCRGQEMPELTSVSGLELPHALRYIAAREAEDSFCAGWAKPAATKRAIDLIRNVWQIDARYVDSERPQILRTPLVFQIGRYHLDVQKQEESLQHMISGMEVGDTSEQYTETTHSLVVLEQVAACAKLGEPCLLVGETGTGKTSSVQHVAKAVNRKLVVINLNQQTDASDLLGGFKPVDVSQLARPIVQSFEKAFCKTFSRTSNATLLKSLHKALNANEWKTLLKLMNSTLDKVGGTTDMSSPKRKKGAARWQKVKAEVGRLEQQCGGKRSFAFSFVEGALVAAIRKGDWVLLDEINLAPAETLERLAGLLDGDDGSVCLTERGDTEAIPRSKHFRLFACMNPPTDAGKKELPAGLRSRFTEVLVPEMTKAEDLRQIAAESLHACPAAKVHDPRGPVANIVNFYLEVRRAAARGELLDGAEARPVYTLRTLMRSLNYTTEMVAEYGLNRSLFDGICMSFLTQLQCKYHPRFEQLITKYLLPGTKLETLRGSQNRGEREGKEGCTFIAFEAKLPQDKKKLSKREEEDRGKQAAKEAKEGFWLECGENAEKVPEWFIVVPSVRTNLLNLTRAVLSKHPTLLQGPTSTGKTSMIEYLALRTGHRFMRINNHDHTEITEYIGGYATDHEGQMVWQDGVLVSALRKGWWLVLDELNLAPSEVLEALNRLLDGNRELFIPETQEIVKPHPNFRLFATQNPPGAYGGRKTLSRAFRNRFLELQVDEASPQELQLILELRSGMPMSFAKKIIDVMKALQQARQGSRLFSGKSGFITPRDLFRWAERKPSSWAELAQHGYMLLAERARKPEERAVVKETIENCMKEAGKIDVDKLYDCEAMPEYSELQARIKGDSMETEASEDTFDASGIVWTSAMKRLFTLLSHCIAHKEPVLLVGGTGIGKTTVCQLFSVALQRQLHIINCHQHTDTADFIGGFRPVREREKIEGQLQAAMDEFLSGFGDDHDASTVDSLTECLEQQLNISTELDEQQQESLDKIREMQTLHNRLFSWADGSLVTAMRGGHLFVIDEISLADDAVLERLNSVLEPGRLLVLAERSEGGVEELVAHEDFRIMATMNPGGDFGKKELSPALRNRFTEIWVSDELNSPDLQMIVDQHYISSGTVGFAKRVVQFAEWLSGTAAGIPVQPLRQPLTLSLRDVMTWITFMNTVNSTVQTDNVRAVLSELDAYLHGAFLVLLDGLGLGRGMSGASEARLSCLNMLEHQGCTVDEFRDIVVDVSAAVPPMVNDDTAFGANPFVIPRGPGTSIPLEDLRYILSGGTYGENTRRVLRAMQLSRPILLEGPPGVGKSSLIEALAKASGHNLVRINLSEQTEISDLMGNDLPVSGGNAGDFAWRDGVFLAALKAGDWVLLDELNLASQAVLEGLNSCLDHRGTVWIPEIGKSFDCPSSFRIFGAQNPLQQGGGRKGLPKSFLNRFTKVYIERFLAEDLERIAVALYPQIMPSTIAKMVRFNTETFMKTSESRQIGRLGSPWDFNLRDILRWAELIVTHFSGDTADAQPGDDDAATWVDLLYMQRFRTTPDRAVISQLFAQVFGTELVVDTSPPFSFTDHTFTVGRSSLPRKKQVLVTADVELLQQQMNSVEAILKAIQMKWLAIIVGDSGAGKTSLIRLLAQLSGNTLCEYTISNSADTSEFLGCFEQVDPSKAMQSTIAQLATAVEDCAELLVLLHKPEAADAAKSLLDATSQLQSVSVSSESLEDTEKQQSVQNQAVQSAQVLQQLQQVMVRFGVAYDTSALEAAVLHNSSTASSNTEAGRFEWVDGKFLEAVEHGGWVVLDNVNLCEPTVLDRLNPLFEIGGVLQVNEQGLLDGEVRTIVPHPEFRLFMVMDPASGEISRAMRNRGLEIFVMPPSVESRDVVMLLSKLGLAGGSLARRMAQFHEALGSWTGTHSRGFGRKPWSVRDILMWGRLAMIQIQSGVSPAFALRRGMTEVYGHVFKTAEEKLALSGLFGEYFDELDSAFWSATLGAEAFCAGVWPHTIKTTDYCWDHKSATMDRQGAVYEMLISRIAFLSLRAASAEVSNVPSSALCVKLALQNQTGSVALDDAQLLAKSLEMAQMAGKMFVHQASLADWSARRDWLVRTHERISHEHKVPEVEHIKDQLVFILEQLFTGTLHDRSAEMVRVLIWHVLPQRHEEEYHTKVAETLGPVEMSLIQLSFCGSQHSQHAQKDAVAERVGEQNYVIEVFYPLFDHVHSLVQCICAETEISDSELVAFENFLVARGKLYQFLSTTQKLSHDRFLVLWRAFTKAYSSASVAAARYTEQQRNVTVCMDAVSSAMKLRAKFPRTLWKHGGFPRMPRSHALADVDAKLLQLCYRMTCRVHTHDSKYETEHAHNAMVAKPDMKRSVSEAVCFLRSLHWVSPSENPLSQGTETLTSSALEQLSNEMMKMPDTLGLQFEEMILTKRPDGAMDISMSLPLWQISDHCILRSEFGLLQQISGLASDAVGSIVGSEKDSITQASMRGAVQEATKLVEFGLQQTARPCVDTVASQQFLLMASDSNGDVSRMLPSVFADMMFNWHSNLWTGVDEAETEEVLHVKDVAKQASDGPGQLSCPLHTVIMAGILEDWDTVPIAQQEAKVEQIRAAAARVCHDVHGSYAGDTLAGFDRQLFLSVLRVTLQCFQHKLDAAASEQVANILAAIKPSSDGNADPEPEPEVAATPVDLATACNALRECLAKTAFKDLFETSLAPICEWLSSLSEDDAAETAALGEMWVLLGLWRMRFLLPAYPVDPVVTYQLKLDMLNRELEDIQYQMDVWHEQEGCYRGRETNEDIQELEERQVALKDRQRIIEEQILPRPVPCQFAQIFQELWDMFENVVSKRAVEILSKLASDQDGMLTEQIASEERMCQRTISRMIKRLNEQFPLYRDVVQPCLLTAYEVKYGLRCAVTAYNARHIPKPVLFPATEELLSTIESDPNALCSDAPYDVWSVPKNLLEISRDMSVAAKLGTNDHGLQVLETCMGAAASSAYLDGSTTRAVGCQISDDVFTHFANVWGASEEQAMRKKEEEALEYHIHATDADPPSIFPDFHDDFKDTGETGDLLNDAEEKTDEEKAAFSDSTLSAVDSKGICHAHQMIYTWLDSREYQPASYEKLSQEMKAAAVASSLKLMAIAAKDGMASELHTLNNVHAVLLGGAEAVTGLTQAPTHTDVPGAKGTTGPSHNVYTAADVAEVRLVRPPLTELCTRLTELLERWEDHPILSRMFHLSQQVLELPVQTPVMKVLTGVEILLHKAQEWQMNASREVSLQLLLNPLMGLIERWRRLELEQWRGLLDSKVVEMEHHCSRYWFFLYRIVNTFEVTDESDARDGIQTMFESIAEFMQRAPIGEYQSRLGLLKQFAQQIKVQSAGLVPADTSDIRVVEKKMLLALLQNVHRYFDQFSSNVNGDMLMLRKPVETKLREFVKISKWDKQNYYSLKAASERSHTKLSLFARQFEEALHQPAGTSIMAAEKRQEMTDAKKDFKRRPEPTVHIGYTSAGASMGAVAEVHFPAIRANPGAAVSLGIDDDQRRQGNLEKLHKKLVSHSATAIFSEDASSARDTSGQYTEALATHIITRALALRENAPLKNMKRKAFSGLLRKLKSIGVKQVFSDPLLLSVCLSQGVPDQIDLSVGISAVKTEMTEKHRKSLDAQWGRSNDYFFRCIFRLQKMRRLSTAFSSELSAVEVGKMTSYVEHLLAVSVDQRGQLRELNESVSQLRFVTAQLDATSTSLQASKLTLFQPSCQLEALQTQLNTFNKMVSYATEKQLIMGAFAKVGPEPVEESVVSAWVQCANIAAKGKCVLEEALQVIKDAKQTGCDILACASAVTTLESTAALATELQEVMRGLQKRPYPVHECLRLAEAADTMVTLSESAATIPTRLSGPEAEADLSPQQQKEQQSKLDAFPKEFGDTFETLVEQVLISTQSMCKVSAAWQKEAAEIEEDDRKAMVPKQCQHFAKMFAAAAMPTLVEKLGRCCALLQHFGDSARSGEEAKHAVEMAGRLLSCIMPMLNDLGEVVSRLLLSFVSFHSSIGKMMFVLLNVFSEIMEKGFCTPPEGEEEEGEGEGDTEDNVSGMGMAEGQGNKDVSDQIEDEEQLLGLKGDEEEQQEDEEQDRGEGKEMENEFEGDMMDKQGGGEEEDDGSEEEDKKDDMDREMDETDEKQDEEVDEKMWGDVEDDPEDENKEDEKDEEVDSMQNTGEKTGQSEGQDKDAKEKDDDGEEQTQMPDDQDEEAHGDQEEQEPNFVDDAKQPEMDLNDDMEIDDEEGGKDEDESAPPEDEKTGEDQTEDIQMPEDKKEDGEDGKEEEEKHDNQKKEEQMDADGDEKPPDDDDGEVKEGDDDKDAEDLDEKEGEDDQADPSMDQPPADLAAEAEEGDDKEDDDDDDDSGEREGADENDPDQDKADQMEEDQKPEDGPLDGDTKEGAEDEDDEEQQDDEDERAAPSKQEQEKFEKQEHTVMDNTGSGDNSVVDQEAEKQDGVNEDEQQDDAQDTMQQQADGTQLAERQTGQGGDPNQANQPEAAPPKSLADAMKEWTERAKRLNTVGDAPETADEEKEAPQNDPESQDKPQDADAYQFLPENAGEGQEDAIAEAATTEHQDDDKATQKEADEGDMDTDKNEPNENDVIADQDDPDKDKEKEEAPLQSTTAKLEVPDQPGDEEEGGDKEPSDDEEEEPMEESDEEEIVGPEWFDEMEAQKQADTEKEEEATEETEAHDLIRSDVLQDEPPPPLLTEDDLDSAALALEEEERDKLREEVEDALKNWWGSSSTSTASKEKLEQLWREYDRITDGPALELCETLRLVLAPTKASKMKGGYAAGKRINMRAVIPYIASGYKKDKIWLRRTQPDKRNYQIIVAIDDSLSMREKRSGQLACEAMLVLCKALERLQVGQVGVVRFGETSELIHPFDQPYNAEAGSAMLGKFTFAQDNADFEQLLKFTSEVFAQSGSGPDSATGAALQLVFVIGDGQIREARDSCRTLIRQAAERGQMCAAIMIDTPDDPSASVTKAQEVSFGPTGKVVITPYLDSYPFNFYTVLQDSEVLPDVLGDALRQWYEMTTES